MIHCPDCGTLTDIVRFTCGWPCSPFGYRGAGQHNEARARFWGRRLPRWWRR